MTRRGPRLQRASWRSASTALSGRDRATSRNLIHIVCANDSSRAENEYGSEHAEPEQWHDRAMVHSSHRLRDSVAELLRSAGSDRTETTAFIVLPASCWTRPVALRNAAGADPSRAWAAERSARSARTLVCVLAFLIAALTFLSKSSPSPRRLPGVPRRGRGGFRPAGRRSASSAPSGDSWSHSPNEPKNLPRNG